MVFLGLVKHDLKQRVAGTIAGWLWIFLRPLLTVLLMWLVFSFGFKVPPVDDVPFALWLSIGISLWLFFSDTLTNITSSFVSYGFLVKQSSLPLIYIPLARLISGLLVHFPLYLLVMILYMSYGDGWRYELTYIAYLLASLMFFLLSAGIFLSTLRVFLKDVDDVLFSVMQAGFWVTPIIWNINLVPERWRWIVELNPVHYIIEGSRQVLLVSGAGFNILSGSTIYFWFVSVSIFLLSITLLRRAGTKFPDFL